MGTGIPGAPTVTGMLAREIAGRAEDSNSSASPACGYERILPTTSGFQAAVSVKPLALRKPWRSFPQGRDPDGHIDRSPSRPATPSV